MSVTPLAAPRPPRAPAAHPGARPHWSAPQPRHRFPLVAASFLALIATGCTAKVSNTGDAAVPKAVEATAKLHPDVVPLTVDMVPAAGLVQLPVQAVVTRLDWVLRLLRAETDRAEQGAVA